MTIVTISRGSFSKGREIAEGVAERLGYECISREVLLEASEHFDIPELRLTKAIHDAPGFLDRVRGGQERYVTFIRAALLRHLKDDDVVYHGLAGHFFIKDVPHVLKVRIIADLEERVRLKADREGIGLEEARDVVLNDDDQRRRWGMHLYGIDTNDPFLYDLVIHTSDLGTDETIDVVCHAARLDSFTTTERSRRMLADLYLAAEVEASLFDVRPRVEVACREGVVHIAARDRGELDARVREELESKARRVEGVEDVAFDVVPPAEYTNPWHKV